MLASISRNQEEHRCRDYGFYDQQCEERKMMRPVTHKKYNNQYEISQKASRPEKIIDAGQMHCQSLRWTARSGFQYGIMLRHLKHHDEAHIADDDLGVRVGAGHNLRVRVGAGHDAWDRWVRRAIIGEGAAGRRGTQHESEGECKFASDVHGVSPFSAHRKRRMETKGADWKIRFICGFVVYRK